MTIFNYETQKYEMIEALEDLRDHAKLVRGNIWDVGMSFDIETTQLNINDVHHAYMYIWQFAVNDICIYGRTWGAFTAFYMLIVQIFKLGQKVPTKGKTSKIYKAICLVHNLPFEFSFICRRLPWAVKKTKTGYLPNIFAKDAHNVVTAVTKHNLEFRCTLNLTDKSLQRLAKDYNLENQKQVGSLDYNKKRNSQTPLTEEELKYCFYDVIILTEFFNKYYSPTYLHGRGKLPTTKTSIIRNELRTHFNDLHKKGLAEYPKGFPTSEKSYKYLMNWIYRGGYCHANAAYTAHEITPETDPEGMDGYDFKSSYPARGILDNVPWEFVLYNGDFYTLMQKWETHAAMFTARFTHLRSKTAHSLESLHKCLDTKDIYVDNGRIAATGENGYITVAMTELDYQNYLKCYTWDKLEIIGNIFVSEKKPLPNYLIDLFCKYYYQKSTIDSKKDPIGYMLSKQNVNILYGLCVSSLFHQNYVWNGKCFELFETFTDFEKLAEKQILLPQWGVWISAASRHAEIDRMFAVGEKGFGKNGTCAAYGDTDSWKYRHPEKFLKAMNKYNKIMNERLLKRDLSGLDFKFVGAKNEAELKEKIKGIGQFVRESHISRFKTLGCKRYIMLEHEVLKDGSVSKDAEIVAKCAGMKSKNFLNMMKGKSIDEIFAAFDFDLELPAEYSGKLANHYNIEPHNDYITDDFGNTERMYEKSSVCLFPIPFKMRGFDDYIAFFTALQQKYQRRF